MDCPNSSLINLFFIYIYMKMCWLSASVEVVLCSSASGLNLFELAATSWGCQK